MNGIFERFLICVGVTLGLSTAALAQWSISQPRTREPPKGQNRYVYLVMSSCHEVGDGSPAWPAFPSACRGAEYATKPNSRVSGLWRSTKQDQVILGFFGRIAEDEPPTFTNGPWGLARQWPGD